MEFVKKLIERNTPELLNMFELEKIEKENGFDVCEYLASNGKILLKGSDNVCLCHAYYCYLKEYSGAYFSHCSSFSLQLLKREAALPVRPYKKVIKQKKRVYLDYITYSNSMWMWQWDKWEKELDFMAMKGVNMALNVVGNDAVLFNALIISGLSERSAAYFISGPAFYAWQTTGKIDSYLPINDYENYKTRLELAKKIFDRMKELEIEPVLSTFNGQISEKIIRLFGKVKSYKIDQWSAFPPAKKIDILDERFKKLMREYMFFQEKEIGKAKYYMCDYFCNFSHKTNKEKYMRTAAEEFDRIIDFCVDEKPCIVFPSDGYNRYFTKSLKKCDTLVFDLDGSMYDITSGFDGNDFIVGNSHNNSPHTSLRGDVRLLCENEYLDILKKYDNMQGVGFFPESLEQNPMYEELMFDVMTSEGKILLDKWLEDYVLRRYGQNDKILEAYRILCDTCYSPENSKTDIGSTMCARPTLMLRHTGICDKIDVSYKNTDLLKAVKLLLESGNTSYNMRFCIVYCVMSLIDNYEYSLYKKIMEKFSLRDENGFKNLALKFVDLFEDAEKLLTSFDRTNALTVFLELQSISKNDEDEKSITLNYLSSHTLWGPLTLDCQRYDYYWIYLSEFMTEYYCTRWEKFFEYLINNFNRKHFETKSPLQFNDRDQFAYNAFYQSMAEYEKSVILNFVPKKKVEGDTFEIAKSIIEKYEQEILDTGD